MHRKPQVRCVLAVATALFAFPLLGQNVIPNPGFDANLDGWSYAQGSVSWSDLDADGSATSGSALILDSRTDFVPATLKGPCLAVPTTVDVGAKYRVPSGQITDGTVRVSLNWYSELTGCTDSPVRSDRLDTDPFSFDQWISAGKDHVTAPIISPPTQQCPPFGGPCDNQPPAARAQIEFDVIRGSLAGPGIRAYADDVFLRQSTCAPDDRTACLNGGRFRVTADWETPTSAGHGSFAKTNDATGDFSFFGPDNTEVVVKVLNACADPFHRYWVFAAGLTNVFVTLSVEDTQTGILKTYVNPQGTPFQPIQDTDAFATCP